MSLYERKKNIKTVSEKREREREREKKSLVQKRVRVKRDAEGREIAKQSRRKEKEGKFNCLVKGMSKNKNFLGSWVRIFNQLKTL